MYKLGIAGYGFVGQAVHSCMSDTEVIIYDPPKKFNDIDALKSCDAIFCCLPTITGQDGNQDFSVYTDFLDTLCLQDYKGILIIKSTVLYKNISPYLTRLNIVMNPEFLSQNNFQRDFFNQRIIVLGGRMDLCRHVAKIYTENFKFNGEIEFEYCSAEEAIALKYSHNTYHALKVLFWNYIHEIHGNHRKIFDLYSRITGNTFEMQNIFADGTPGYGGCCFPKDVKASYEEWPHLLTDFMIKYNTFLRKDIKKD